MPSLRMSAQDRADRDLGRAIRELRKRYEALAIEGLRVDISWRKRGWQVQAWDWSQPDLVRLHNGQGHQHLIDAIREALRNG